MPFLLGNVRICKNLCSPHCILGLRQAYCDAEMKKVDLLLCRGVGCWLARIESPDQPLKPRLPLKSQPSAERSAPKQLLLTELPDVVGFQGQLGLGLKIWDCRLT